MSEGSNVSILDQVLGILCVAQCGVLESEVSHMLGPSANMALLHLKTAEWVVQHHGTNAERATMTCSIGLLWISHDIIRKAMLTKLSVDAHMLHRKLAVTIAETDPAMVQTEANHTPGWRHCQVQPLHMLRTAAVPLGPLHSQIKRLADEVTEATHKLSFAARDSDYTAAKTNLANAEAAKA